MSSSIAFFALLICVAWSATVQWTGSGGTNLWDNPRNWDCGSCLPTLADDVVIAFTHGATSIRIGAPARAKTLTIGGSQTPHFQALTVSGSLTVGGGTLHPNAGLYIETGNNAPFNITGTFTANGKGLVFGSGLLGGNGTLYVAPGAFLNFSGPAAKEISGNLKVDGSAAIISSAGSSIFVKERGSVVINGQFESKSGLEVIVEPTATFSSSNQGSFTFNGPKLLLQGAVSLGKWSVQAGAVTVINKLTSGSLTMGSSSTLQLIGAPTEQRTFGSISGGSIKQEGGQSSYGSLDVSSLALVGGSASFSGQVKIGQFALSGGSVSGGSVSSNALSVDFSVVSGGAKLTTANLDLKGILSLEGVGSSLIVAPSGQARVSAQSQITFSTSSSFVLSQGSSMNQGAPLKLVSGAAQNKDLALNQNGAWSSSSVLTSLGVPVSGNGQFSLTASGSIEFTNSDFATGSLQSAGSVKIQQGKWNIGTVTGSGSFSGSPVSFSSQQLSANSFLLDAGQVNIVKPNVATLEIRNGAFNFTAAQVGTLNLVGGVFGGNPGAGAKASVNSLVLRDAPAKTIANCAVALKTFNVQAGNTLSTLIVNGATIATGN